jgi:hypothetical protein
MNDHAQIFTLDEVAERASLSPGVKGIHIYNGHINESTGGKSVLTMYIRRDPGGNWPADQMAYINKLRGNFTVVLKPSNEFFYITSYQEQTAPNLFNGAGVPTENLLDLVNKITALEAEKALMSARIVELTEDLKNFETAGDKFSYALEQLFYKVAPKFGLMPELNEQPLNGIPQMENWQKIQLGNEVSERNIESALEVIYTAFGEEFLLKFAHKIQAQPGLVNQLKSMI